MTESNNPTTARSKETSAPSETSPEADPEANEAKLQALIAEYELRFDEVAELIKQVRHDINNPLTGVLGQAQLLLREDLSDKARARAVTIEQQAGRIRDIVARLRQVQKGPKG
jgi:nitrogen-specific signal transduction histidine kinase